MPCCLAVNEVRIRLAIDGHFKIGKRDVTRLVSFDAGLRPSSLTVEFGLASLPSAPLLGRYKDAVFLGAIWGTLEQAGSGIIYATPFNGPTETMKELHDCKDSMSQRCLTTVANDVSPSSAKHEDRSEEEKTNTLISPSISIKTRGRSASFPSCDDIMPKRPRTQSGRDSLPLSTSVKATRSSDGNPSTPFPRAPTPLLLPPLIPATDEDDEVDSIPLSIPSPGAVEKLTAALAALATLPDMELLEEQKFARRIREPIRYREVEAYEEEKRVSTSVYRDHATAGVRAGIVEKTYRRRQEEVDRAWEKRLALCQNQIAWEGIREDLKRSLASGGAELRGRFDFDEENE
ncbi:hypothetical protein BOTBODRAFT_620937 [Botryobasidium botryosum FD-172 SS1]|uniref:Uncharacterized protein n=1 Tax=Botryobasidium botryosum (strain FD-172 SS1) TaxID=930990 RepID=A0A067M5J7_BOTB1|nr:hypothetical protein BOTBODRAFT_620937 [Botryobasidium botryosum FD-172 SS1]